MFLSNILYQLKTDVLQFQNEVNTTRHWAAATMPYMAEKQMQQSVCMLNMPLCVSVVVYNVCNGTEEMFVLHKEEAVYGKRSSYRESRKEERERERERDPVNAT